MSASMGIYWSSRRVTNGELPHEHALLFAEARGGIERLVARMKGPPDSIVFLVAEADGALGKVIVEMGAPRHPGRRSVVMPLTRDDAVRAAGPLMGPTVSEKLAAHGGPAVLIVVAGDARLVGL
jgi:hypothetical protein